jgi:hypothetical protein
MHVFGVKFDRAKIDGGTSLVKLRPNLDWISDDGYFTKLL